VVIVADESNGLDSDSAGQCQRIRSVSVERVESVRWNVGRGDHCWDSASVRPHPRHRL